MIDVISLGPEDFRNLTQQQRESYQSLLDSRWHVCLQGQDPWGVSDSHIYGVAIHDPSQAPLGLILATYRIHLRLATVVAFLAVDENPVMAKTLVEELEKILLSQRCIGLDYIDASPPTTKEVLEQCGWSAPELLIIRCHFKKSQFHPPWLKFSKLLSEGYEIFLWKDLRSDEREELLKQERQGNFPLYVSPFYKENHIEHLNSLGLRHNNAVIGWMLTTRIDDTTIVYSSFYIASEYRHSPLPITLLATSISYQLTSTIENGLLEFNLRQVDQRWVNFVKKRLIPWSTQVEKLFLFRRSLEQRMGPN